METKYKVIFMVGPPGVGKNTQCDKLVEKYKFIHFRQGIYFVKKSQKELKMVNK